MKKKKPVEQPLPQPVKSESRICFGIKYFATDAEACAYGDHVRQRGDTYNGGWLDGLRCGRDRGYDYVDDELGPLYAVTVA